MTIERKEPWTAYDIPLGECFRTHMDDTIWMRYFGLNMRGRSVTINAVDIKDGHIAEFRDMEHVIPVRCKVTVEGVDGNP